MITTVCKISYGSQTVPPIVPAVQGDTGRAISFEIADFTPPAGATATYFILKPSGEAIYNSATITDNSILCELTAQSLAEAGENRMQVRVLQGEDIVTSFEVILMVRTFLGDDAMESGTEMNIFDQAVEQATEQFQENAEQIVEEVIESIPEDYTELTEEVDELNERIGDVKSAISPLYAILAPQIIANSYWPFEGSSAGIPLYYSGWSRTDRLPCVEGETLKITTTVASAYNIFFNTDTDGDVNSSFSLSVGENNIVVPQGASFYALSNTTEGMTHTSIKQIIDGTTVNNAIPIIIERLGNVKSQIDDVGDVIQHRESYDFVDITSLIGKKENTFIKSSTGEEVTVSNCLATDYIDISKYINRSIEMNCVCSSYSTLRIYQGAFYDSSKNYISGYHSGNLSETIVKTFSVPTNARYIRMSIPKDVTASFYAKMKTKVYKLLGNSIDSPIINYDDITPGGYINKNTGDVTTSGASVGYTGYISLYNCAAISIKTTAGTDNYQMAFYDSVKQYVSGADFNATEDMYTISVPENAEYARFSVVQNNYTDFCYILIGINVNKALGILNDLIKEQGESKLHDKKISFLGDSITTYNGYIPSGYVTFYPKNTVTDVSLTWWKKLIDKTGMELLKNASWSGSNICGNTLDTTGAVGCSDARVNALADGNTVPDIIVVFIGINDFGHASYDCGNYDGSTVVPSGTTISTITEAYGVLFKKLQSTYKNAKIFACTLMAEQGNSSTGMANSYPNGFPNINRRDNVTLPTLNEYIKKICTAFGVAVIPFAETINFYNALDYTGDGLHPNALQMDKMYLLARNVIESCF